MILNRRLLVNKGISLLSQIKPNVGSIRTLFGIKKLGKELNLKLLLFYQWCLFLSPQVC